MKKHKKIILLTSTILLSLLVAKFLILRFSPYPALSKFLNQNYSTRIYDCNKNLIQVLSLENGLKREWTDLKNIPSSVKKIFIKAEDKRFYFHFGVDYLAVLKAIFQNLSAKKTVRGASTITMQVVKIISGSTKSRTFAQKLQDIFNAHRLEARLSKNQILELYLNSVPFGMNCEGVTSAARSFFGLELSELSLEQIKCLSVIPRSPSFYNPIKNPENCAKAANVNLEVAKTAFPYEYPFFMPHYVNFIKSTANKKNIKLPPEIFVNADLSLQFYAQELLQNAIFQSASSRISNGAILVLKNDDCSVLSWLGNNWFDKNHSGQIDGVLAKNQMGSSMKPFLYALALDTKDENGNPLYYPSKILADIPTEFGNSNLYIPLNFNNQFNGPVRLRVALASSLNVPAVRVLSEIGVEKYLETLFDLGFDSLKQNGKNADLGLALGAAEVSLAELVPAFSIFVQDGNFIPLNLTGNDEKIFSLEPTISKQVFSTDSARLICSILSDKASRALGFGYSQSFQTSYPSIFKTGTANQYQSIVALGSTKKFTVGVWMGNLSGETVIGKTGSSLPAYIAKNILDYLEKNSNYKNPQVSENNPQKNENTFLEPENWTKTKICSLSGMIASQNCPSSVYEYVKNEIPQEKCTWHVKNNSDDFDDSDKNVIIKFPAEYQSWVLENKISAQIDYNNSPLKIQSPQNNAIFYYSVQNSEYQFIRVEITGGKENILSVEYDDKFFGDFSRPFQFSLPVEKGFHKLKIKCAAETQELHFTVK